MADFILSDLDVKSSNVPIEFDLQFDIDRKKVFNNFQADTILLDAIQEVDYYNLALIDENNSENTEIKIDIMKEFKNSFEVFSLENVGV